MKYADKTIPLSEAVSTRWYEIIHGADLIHSGVTIQYIKCESRQHLVISESLIDEIGLTFSQEDAEKIMIKELFFTSSLLN